jgi:hypothetical protein
MLGLGLTLLSGATALIASRPARADHEHTFERDLPQESADVIIIDAAAR